MDISLAFPNNFGSAINSDKNDGQSHEDRTPLKVTLESFTLPVNTACIFQRTLLSQSK